MGKKCVAWVLALVLALCGCSAGGGNSVPAGESAHPPAGEAAAQPTPSPAPEAMGSCRWPRLREVVEFSKRMGYTRLGLAFCAGLHREAEVVDRVLRQNGFQVASVICKTGSIPKDRAGVPPEYRVRPGTYEVMCNPIAQAELLNRVETPFNICLGLCVGHDSLFYRYSQAPVTTLVAKDRATGNNPVAAIYCADSYFKTRLDADQP